MLVISQPQLFVENKLKCFSAITKARVHVDVRHTFVLVPLLCLCFDSKYFLENFSEHSIDTQRTLNSIDKEADLI